MVIFHKSKVKFAYVIVQIFGWTVPLNTQIISHFFLIWISLFFSHSYIHPSSFNLHFCVRLLSSLISQSSLLPAPPPTDSMPWPTRVSQLQLWPMVRRLRQRLSVTPTGSQRCLAVVLVCEWRVQSARRGGEPLTPWLLPEFALSRAEVTRDVLSAPPHTSRSPFQIAAIRADDTIIALFSVSSL